MFSMLPVFLLGLCALGRISGSPFTSSPFFVMWNAPTADCQYKYGVDLNLKAYNIMQNPNQRFMGDNITIFYKEKLGLYPYITEAGDRVNGGVPQNASLQQHLQASKVSILNYIPNPDFQGMAVVDWEEWRPLWARNWDQKRVYWNGSRELVWKLHPDWSPAQVEKEAKRSFEAAARAFMESTIRMGESMKPGGLWGYYGLPPCFNYQYKNSTANYTGACPDLEVERNNQLGWLWNASSALFPDIYLEIMLRGTGTTILRYVRPRIQEAQRLAQKVLPAPLPVIPYARIAFTFSLEFLSLEELVYSIGESAAMGSAGVVLWGDSTFAKSKGTCLAIKKYLDETLGHYMLNVTTAAQVCSEILCSGHGRCQRAKSAHSAYLHLDPRYWAVVKKPASNGNYWTVVKMHLDKSYKQHVKAEFRCDCFPGWKGKDCSQTVAKSSRSKFRVG